MSQRKSSGRSKGRSAAAPAAARPLSAGTIDVISIVEQNLDDEGRASSVRELPAAGLHADLKVLEPNIDMIRTGAAYDATKPATVVHVRHGLVVRTLTIHI